MLKIYVSQVEWDEMRNPNIRSRNTYWKENWEPIQHQVKTFEKSQIVLPGIEMIHTGGHSDGHSVIKLTQNGETVLHMGDIDQAKDVFPLTFYSLPTPRYSLLHFLFHG